jgi:DNA polymerase III subunit epsilon
MYAIVDIETTGGYAENHRITEIAIVHHDGLQIGKKFKSLINPGRPIPSYITGLTGITNEMVLDAPRFEDIASEIAEALSGKVFVAHNAHFDYSFLKKEFEQAGIPWQTKKLCTVRLSRKIIPGLRSYSLGSIAESVGIKIANRHRASGDADATVSLFSLLLNRDHEGHILKALKRNSGETILPPNLPKADYETLPAKPGVYYFTNARGRVIYVGKAANIKKRIAGHFSGDAREWSRQNIRNEIHRIRYELTGNEMIALIYESQEIRRLWPKYNQSQKIKVEEWGIYAYEDRNGYQRFSVNTVMRGSQPLIRFGTKGDAWNFLWEKVRNFELCPKLCGLQTTKGLCFQHQTGECLGACLEIESPKKYNKRVIKMLETIQQKGASVLIMGKGRSTTEQTVIVVRDGSYVGHGFFDRKKIFSSIDEAQKFVQLGIETPTVHNLISSYLSSPKENETIFF